jgi:hypothetical protein
VRTPLLPLAALLLLAAGCANPPPEAQGEAARKAAAHTELREYMDEHKDKAKDAEQQQLERAEADRKAVEEAGG